MSRVNDLDPHQIWKYGHGTWSRIDPPFGWANIEYTEALRAAGFVTSAGSGWPDMDDVEIHEHRDRNRWIIDWSPTADNFYTIEVTSIPDLVELLSKPASISTAYLLTSISNHLEALVFNAAEDAERERKRRYPEPGTTP